MKIGRDSRRWQCSTSRAIFLCSWDLENDDDSLVGQLTSGNVACGKSDKHPKQREMGGGFESWFGSVHRGLGQRQAARQRLEKGSMNDKLTIPKTKQTDQSIH